MEQSSIAFKVYLLVTAALSGALVMAIEVLGARAVAPFFGVSLFVWTALIAVTLLALAAGYLFGGILADRKNGSPGVLFGLIGAAGILVLVIPLVKVYIFQAALPLGLRWGTLISATFLFGPPLFLLGCVSPFIVRLATKEWDRLGRTVGLLYALSTAGSFFGTLITGYYIIAAWGVSRAFQVTGMTLLLLAAIYFVVFRGRFIVLLLPVLALAAGATIPKSSSAKMPGGTQVHLVETRDGFYGRVQVIEYQGGTVHTREMVIDALIQGGIDVSTGQSVYAYPHLLEHLAVSANPAGRRALVIGLGPAIVPRLFSARGIETEIVDIDPTVVTVAQTYFGLPASQMVHLADARYFLATTTSRYDYIVLDVFNGDTTPGHLLTREALELVRARLAPGGVLALNMVGSLGKDKFMTVSVIRTLESVFPWVKVVPMFNNDNFGNMEVVAGIGTPLTDIPTFNEMNAHPLTHAVLRKVMAQSPVLIDSKQGIILTDDYNPIDVLDLPMKEEIRRGILQSTPHVLLLG